MDAGDVDASARGVAEVPSSMSTVTFRRKNSQLFAKFSTRASDVFA